MYMYVYVYVYVYKCKCMYVCTVVAKSLGTTYFMF